MSTLEYQTLYPCSGLDPALDDLRQRRFLYVFWHEYLLYQFYLRGHCQICMLLSRNGDAEILSYAARYMGFEVVRGSTFSGGQQAVRGLLRAAHQYHLTITPDGPRGPRRRLAAGPIYLASRLQIPLVALGMGYQRPWRLNSWDRFAIPRPYSRARCIVSPPMHIPSRLSQRDLEYFRAQVESELTSLTVRAESWAESGERLTGAVMTRRQPRPRTGIRGPGPLTGTDPPGTVSAFASRHAA
jgi:lysophospholipid acyltransferase (LPLAT)-like uncharacterized protein